MNLDPSKTTFLFPGQGSQAIGMGQALAKADKAAATIFEQADNILGYSLSEICWEGPEEKINDTLYTQPAMLTHSIAVFYTFKSRYPDFIPTYTAGHSLGEFSALVAAEALNFPDALLLVQERGRAMKAAGEYQPGGMAAVLGMQLPEVEEICQQVSSECEGGVWVANDNCPGQVVISGDRNTLDVVSGRLKEGGARKVLVLSVSISSHSPLMEPALDDFNQALRSTSIQDPQIPVFGNVSAEPLHSAIDVRNDLGAQLTARVRWTESIRAMINAGITTFVELGAGSVLTGLLHRIDRSVRGLSLNNPTSFDALSTTQ
jgi:[acyl-carrier-protein] S-malonyltransferase